MRRASPFRALVSFLLRPVLLLALFSLQSKELQAQGGASLPRVILTPILEARDPSHRSIRAIGELTAQKRRLERARVAGRVTHLPARAGQYLAQGDLVLELEHEQEGFVFATYKQRALEGGVVARRLVDLHQSVALHDPLVELYDPSSLRLALKVAQSHFSHVALGDSVMVMTEQGPIKAQVSEIESSVDPSSLSFLLYADLMVEEKQELRELPLGMRLQAVIEPAKSSSQGPLAMLQERGIKPEEEMSLFKVREEAIYFSQGTSYLFVASPQKSQSDQVTVKRFEVMPFFLEGGYVYMRFKEQREEMESSNGPLRAVARGQEQMGGLVLKAEVKVIDEE